MGVKKTLPTYKLFDNETVPDGLIVVSSPTNITNLDNISIQCEAIGIGSYNPLTRFSVLVSNDNLNYYPLDLQYPDFSLLDYSFIININELSQPWIKFQFNNASGNDVNLNVTIFGKDLN